jgi:hypothetical protein
MDGIHTLITILSQKEVNIAISVVHNTTQIQVADVEKENIYIHCNNISSFLYLFSCAKLQLTEQVDPVKGIWVFEMRGDDDYTYVYVHNIERSLTEIGRCLANE